MKVGEEFQRGREKFQSAPDREQSGNPSCSQNPHFGKCSLDARSEGQPDHSFFRKQQPLCHLGRRGKRESFEGALNGVRSIQYMVRHVALKLTEGLVESSLAPDSLMSPNKK
jgi:hypothetical protein